MQNPAFAPYTVDELKQLIRPGIQPYYTADEITPASNILHCLVNDCGLTFFTLTDYSKMKYLHVSEGVEHVTGYSHKMFVNGGLEFLFSLFHPDETESLRLVHRKIVDFFHSLVAEDKLNYSYAYDVRLRKADGNYIRVLCQLDCVKLGADGHLSIGREMYTDITSYDTYSGMKLEISHYNKLRGTEKLIYQFDPAPVCDKLSKREKEVSSLVNQGLSSKEIGEKLHLSKHTVDTYRRKIRRKGTIMENVK